MNTRASDGVTRKNTISVPTGNVTIEVGLPPNNGVIYTIGVWDKEAEDWQFGPKSDLVMPGEGPDQFRLGDAGRLDGDFLCIAAKLIPLEGTEKKYWAAFKVVETGQSFRSATFETGREVSMVYRLEAA